MSIPILDIPSAVQLAALRVKLRQRFAGQRPSALDAIAKLVKAPTPGPQQEPFLDSPAKRRIIRAGRRGGKTVGMAILALRGFLAGRRVLYAAPTADQIEAFWWEVKAAMLPAVDAGLITKNETERLIELPGTHTRIRGKTAFNADTLRGDYADLLLMDEWQLMNEDAWERVGVPMLLDNNGDVVFCYTPPSLHSRSLSKAGDPRHAAKLFKAAQADTTGRWSAFHFTSRENPYISEQALGEIAVDMTSLAYRQEILAEDVEEIEGALWKRAWIDARRVPQAPEMARVVVAIDPAASQGAGSDQTGIAVAGLGRDGEGYVLHAQGYKLSPHGWAGRAVDLFDQFGADRILGEVNNGGDMVASTIHSVRPNLPLTVIHASRGKAVRAEPVAALYEHGKIHHVGQHPEAEDQMCSFPVAAEHDDIVDGVVYAITELMLTNRQWGAV